MINYSLPRTFAMTSWSKGVQRPLHLHSNSGVRFWRNLDFIIIFIIILLLYIIFIFLLVLFLPLSRNFYSNSFNMLLFYIPYWCFTCQEGISSTNFFAWNFIYLWTFMCEVIISFNVNVHVYFTLGNCWRAIIVKTAGKSVGIGLQQVALLAITNSYHYLIINWWIMLLLT